MTTLSVVIPAYNEENGIAEIAKRVLSIRNDLNNIGIQNLELIVVDDGSQDRTVEIVSAMDCVRVIKHATNRGYGAALKTGFFQAEGELIGFLDADGTYPPEYFPQLCQKALAGGELIIGSRMAGADSEMPITRRIGNLFFAKLLSIIGRQLVTDSASGMRVFHRELLAKVYPLPDGLNLTPVMSTRALHEGISMIEVPIPYSERVGSSKLSVVRDGSLFLQSIIWTALTYNPVRILGLIGLGLSLVTLLTFAWLVITRLQGVTSLTGWGIAALFTGFVAAISSIAIFSLGIIFNYLVSLFHKRPIRQGLFGKPLLKKPLDQHFAWAGSLFLIAGLIIAVVSLSLSINGWDISRVWLYMMGSSMFILIGIQLILNWILLRVLEELSKREIIIANELSGSA